MTSIVQLFAERNPSLISTFERLLPFYNSRDFFIRILRDSHKEIGLSDVLCHGDLWFYNMMWKTAADFNNNDSDKRASNEIGALIDWQNIHTGSIGEDLGHMLAFCCDSPVRRHVESEYLPQYFKDLKEAVEQKGCQLKVTFEQFLRAYNRQFIAHAMHLPFIACVMLSIKETTPEERQRRTEILVQRTQDCWNDALLRLQEEFPEYFV
ncbi:hypothetical protein WR25_23293 [Diploscapter pachys]|uniref:CHK kinase-like domain-containing protein n=1 Tax=Diploscapter pachys TaxID=2018661 RepID=A0A2A2J7P0_9BILA|nr:hypothetical protein WR25_23293 [Diploscapter pachys]